MNFSFEQPLIYKTLNNMIKKGRIPQAFIFYGESGTSKKEVAKYFIKEVYKKELPLTDNDSILKRIDDESHINVYYIKRDKETTISKDYLLDVIKTSERTSLENGPRFYIIEDADNLNKQSMNELLKFVEEPRDNIYIIFFLENLSNLQDTIISRCSLFFFKPTDILSLKEKLSDIDALDSIKNSFTRYYQNETLVREMISDKKALKMYELVVDMFKERFETNGSLILYFNEHYSSIKDNQELYVSLILYYIEDILSKKLNGNLTFTDEEERIEELSNIYSINKISKFVEKIIEIKSFVQQKKPIKLDLHLTSLLLKMEMEGRRK